MTEPALSIAFFDPKHGLHANARTGTTLLFDGSASNVLPEGPSIEREGDGWRAELSGAFSLAFDPIAESAALGPVTAHVCEVRGTVGSQEVSCLGTVAETRTPPAWEHLDALRTISAVFDSDNAFLALGRRPRGAPGHDEDQMIGWLLRNGEPLAVEETRLSTVYDQGARQRSAGLELWMPGEEFPRRLAGSVVAGSPLALEGLEVHVGIFRWRMEDHEGIGAYEVWARTELQAA